MSARAQLLAKRGNLDEAERLGREAVDLMATTDEVVEHGEELVALAEVLRIKGDLDESRATLREALTLFERKEDLVHARQTRALLAEAGS